MQTIQKDKTKKVPVSLHYIRMQEHEALKFLCDPDINDEDRINVQTLMMDLARLQKSYLSLKR